MKKKHGGKRKKSGRKTIADKKELIPLYVRGSEIRTIGGMDETKTICYDAIDNKVKEKTENNKKTNQ